MQLLKSAATDKGEFDRHVSASMKYTREALGVTQGQVADAARLTTNAYAIVERGERGLGLYTYFRIALALAAFKAHQAKPGGRVSRLTPRAKRKAAANVEAS